MAEGSANKAKISDRDKKILFIVGGLAILALAYFLGFQKMMEKRSTLVEENITLEQEVNKLLGMVANKAKVEQETQQYQTDREKILANYPPELRTQDVIYQLDLMEQEVKNLVLETEGYTMNQIFFSNGALLDAAVQDVAVAPADTTGGTATAITGYRSDINTTCKTDYKSLIKMIDFINNNENRMVIDNVTLNQGEGEKQINCSMTLKMYAVSGTEKEYKDPAVPSGKTGKDELFAGSGN